MKRNEERFFHKGKRARRKGLPRRCEDSRLHPANRLAFLAGWDEQDRYESTSAIRETKSEKRERLGTMREGMKEIRETLQRKFN